MVSCSREIKIVDENSDTELVQGTSVPMPRAERSRTNHCGWTLFPTLMSYLCFQPFFSGPRLRFCRYAGLGSGGEQRLLRFLPPHSRRVYFIIVVLPIVVRCFP